MAELLKIQPASPQIATRPYPVPAPPASYIGRGLTRLGVEMMREQEREQEQQDIFKIEETVNRLHETANDLSYGEKGALTLKGQNVFDLGEPLAQVYGRQYDEQMQQLEAGLENDNQKQRFRIVAGRLRNQFGRQLQVHEANERKAVRESTFKGVVATESEAISRAIDQVRTPPAAIPQVEVTPEVAGATVESGNIDIMNRPQVVNPDGSVSSVRSMSFNEDGAEILIPTVSDDGKILSDDDAIAEYRRTGRHLGKFQSEQAATQYAKALHVQQEKLMMSGTSDPMDQVRFSIGRVTANARNYYANELGLGREHVNAEVLKLESAMHKVVIDQYLERNDPAAAKVYFEANRDRINAVDAETARKQIDKDNRDFMVNQAADKIWLQMGPKKDDDPVNLDLMMREANKVFEKDADGRKLLISELDARRQAHDYSANERKAAVEGNIWQQVIEGRPLSTIRRSPSFRGLDGKVQAQMIGQIEAYQKRNENDPATQLQKFAQFWAISSQPEKLAAMSDAEIFSRAPVLGLDLTKHLLAEKQKLLKQEEKVIEAKIDQDSFNYWAREAGLDVSPKPNTDKAKELGALKYRVETVIDLEQRRTGKPLRREEKDAILKKLLTEVPVTVKGRLWGTTTEPRRLFEVQYPENIQIPQADRDAIAQTLRQAGIENPTPEQIREGFIRLRMK